MKHTILKTISALTLAVLLTACQSTAPASEELSSQVDSAVASTSEVTSSENKSSSASLSSSDEDTLSAETVTSLEKLAHDVAEFPTGTAGASMKAVQIANNFLPFGDALKSHPNVLIRALKKENLANDFNELQQQWEAIAENIQGLVKKDAITIATANDAGVDVKTSLLKADEWKSVCETIAKGLK
ncbi:hypothetical protein [Levyella massiliensis]|uniref:hypothetical protein n=1 Tax=Levyella massiliensis TaxID=938289 RepID=UPI0024AD4014|nr:hypothetical protein [Levyella massiliensis]